MKTCENLYKNLLQINLCYFLQRVEDILNELSVDEIECLRHEPVEITIPPEFRRSESTKSIRGTILSPHADSNGHTLIRFRPDLVIDANGESSCLSAALTKLKRLATHLCDSESRPRHVKCMRLRNNQILFFDNARWLHGRTEIIDRDRHLLRIRFQTKCKAMLPWYVNQ